MCVSTPLGPERRAANVGELGYSTALPTKGYDPLYVVMLRSRNKLTNCVGKKQAPGAYESELIGRLQQLEKWRRQEITCASDLQKYAFTVVRLNHMGLSQCLGTRYAGGIRLAHNSFQ